MNYEYNDTNNPHKIFLEYLNSFHTLEYKTKHPELFGPEFDNLYNEEIRPILRKIENPEGIKIENVGKTLFYIFKFIVILILFLVATYFLFCGIIKFFPSLEPTINNIFSSIITILIMGIFSLPVSLPLIIIISYATCKHNARKQKFKKLKRKIFPILFSNIAKCKYYSNEEVKKDKLYPYMLNLSMVKKRGGLFQNYKDDRFRIIYKDLKIDICECITSGGTIYVLEKKVSTRGGCGLFLATKSPKHFQGKTIIRKKYSYINSDKSDDVILENSEFNKKFLVESTDQVEARYLITPIFMERLLKIAERYKINEFNISFERGNVNILIFGDEVDRFEFTSPLQEIEDNIAIKACRAIILEILDLISILETLKLDESV